MPDTNTQVQTIRDELGEVEKLLGDINEKITQLEVQRDRMVTLSEVFARAIRDFDSLPEQLELPLSD
tara:strand:+ start:43 stop:243 length:201 start_codon:yes stop_codon:yes gene_type:complete